jgi:hypothetical protein
MCTSHIRTDARPLDRMAPGSVNSSEKQFNTFRRTTCCKFITLIEQRRYNYSRYPDEFVESSGFDDIVKSSSAAELYESSLTTASRLTAARVIEQRTWTNRFRRTGPLSGGAKRLIAHGSEEQIDPPRRSFECIRSVTKLERAVNLRPAACTYTYIWTSADRYLNMDVHCPRVISS